MDINDAFEQILLSEERIAEESYKKGFEKGVSEGNLEAYHIGFHRGAEIGAELGFYLAVLENHKIPAPIDQKVLNLITQLKGIIEQFPQINCDTFDLFESLNTIRAQFKKLTSLLKITNLVYPQKSDLSF
jgi:flagellar biosynthesis/type III secretory pathway protein FliH